jgi:DNA (cytosine-5)-methyltransferase 1
MMREDDVLTVGSLFSGIGGLDLGLERAGMTVKWQVEIDDYANRVLAKHWPNVARFRDVRECGAHNLETVDLICGGFPCQDVSLAGKRAGLEGHRSTLWGEFARIIGELRPRWVLAENVVGLLSANSGQFFGNVLRDLDARGYDAEWDCIPAAAVGAPHQRDRLFLVAHATSLGLVQGAIFEGGLRQRCEAWGADTHLLHYEITGRSYRGFPSDLRVDYGVSNMVDRLRALGNAVVPQVAEWIGRRIMQRARVTADAPMFAEAERR